MFLIKYLVLFLSSFWLFGGDDSEDTDKSSEETKVEQVDNEDDDAEDNADTEDANKEEDDDATEEDDEQEAEVVGSREVSSDITETTLTGPDGTDITAMFENNVDPIEEFEDAEESDETLEDVLKHKDEVTSYYSEAFLFINVFDGEEEPRDSDIVGLTAEINENEDELQVYSGQWYEEAEEIFPYAYADNDTLLYLDEGTWTDITGQAEAEEIYYGTYSAIYDALMESEDVVEVYEDDDNYYLINVGQEEVLHETFGTIYNVEFTNADMDEQNNAVLAIVDKESNELSELTYITNAPGLQEGQELQIEVAAKFDNYGEYDDRVTQPTEGDEVDVYTSSEESRTGVNASSAPSESASTTSESLEGETLTGSDNTEITAVTEDNQGLAASLEEAEDADVELEEIFKDKEEINSYYSEFEAMIRLIEGSEETNTEEKIKATAEIDEANGELEIYSEVASNDGELEPSVYASEAVYFQYSNGSWSDLTAEGDVEDVYNPTYSNMYDVFMENEDLIEVKEDDDYYYLYNISKDMEIHDTFGQIFGAEIQNGDTSEQVNAIIGILDKETNELAQVSYMSTAPSLNGEGAIHLEMAGVYEDYGEFDDDGVTVPEEIFD